MGFEDPAVAASARDVMERHIIKVINQERPPYRYATVVQIDPDLRSCLVRYTNQSEPIRVKFGSVRPTEVGQVVRVAGAVGDRYISDVVGRSSLTEYSPVEIPQVQGLVISTGLHSITAIWNEIPDANHYNLQISENASFTQNVMSFYTKASGFTVGSLTPGVTYYVRVRAMTGYGGAGPWSATQSATPDNVPDTSEITDGFPPTHSPQPIVDSGLGYLYVMWPEVPNPDLTTYEVHISTENGFTPSASTHLVDTGGTFFFINNLPDGTRLEYDTIYFVRIIAKDSDGAAPVGAQGYGEIDRVNTGDVGRIEHGQVSDGLPPQESPTPVATAGINFIHLRWAHVNNEDPLTYEIYVSPTENFDPGVNNFVGTTPSNFFFVQRLGQGQGHAELEWGVTYYIRVRATDVDGVGPHGPQVSGIIRRVGTTDVEDEAIQEAKLSGNSVSAEKIIAGAVVAGKIAANAVSADEIAAGTITAESGILANLAVQTANIADLGVTNAKMASLSVSRAKIQNLAVSDAKINTVSASKLTAGTISGETILVSGSTGIIRSSQWTSGSVGWIIRGDGYAEFSNVAIRGWVTASTILTSNSSSHNRIRITSSQTTVNQRIEFLLAGRSAPDCAIYTSGGRFNISATIGFARQLWLVGDGVMIDSISGVSLGQPGQSIFIATSSDTRLITFGPTDSAGTGYRALRVPN